MNDDSGILSIDFIVGFTIFMLAFIAVVTLSSYLIIGLQSKTIDYDAVAYRTGVILAEDPGYAYVRATNNYTESWETITFTQAVDVKRIGLAKSRTTPGILSQQKVEKFRFLYTNPATKLDDYKIRSVFGDYPYQYNISIRTLDNSQAPIFIGNTVPTSQNNNEWGGYGYIRRFVKIKEPSSTTVDAYGYNNSVDYRYMKINIDLDALYARNPVYSIDPVTEKISINITNISSTVNSTDPVKLLNAKLYIDNPPVNSTPDTGDIGYSKPVDYSYLSTNATGSFTTNTLTRETSGDVTDWLRIDLNPEFFIDYNLPVPPGGQYYIKLEFDPDTTYMGGSYSYDDVSVTSPPYLIPAVMEVKVW